MDEETGHHGSPRLQHVQDGTRNDQTAVVDQYGRMHGIRGLRIVDASIIPEAVRANPNLTVIAMAEMAADFVKES